MEAKVFLLAMARLMPNIAASDQALAEGDARCKMHDALTLMFLNFRAVVKNHDTATQYAIWLPKAETFVNLVGGYEAGNHHDCEET